MSDTASEIWSYPPRGVVPDLADMLQAQSMSELYSASEPGQRAALAAIEADRDAAIADARAMSEDLKSTGIDFDVDRMLRPSLRDRVLEVWDDLMDRWRDWRAGPSRDAVAMSKSSMPFEFDLLLARTRPTAQIALEYSAIDAEMDRVVEALTRQISAQRGRLPLAVHLPDAVMDKLAEAEDWVATEEMAFVADTIRAYWPPLGQPALALCVVQEDGGLPIELRLYAHDSGAHRRFEAGMAELGGAIR